MSLFLFLYITLGLCVSPSRPHCCLLLCMFTSNLFISMPVLCLIIHYRSCSKISAAAVQTYRSHHCKTYLDRNIISNHNAAGPLSRTGVVCVRFSMMATVKIEDFVYRSTPLVPVLMQQSEKHSERGVALSKERETEMQRDRLSH